MLAIPGAANPAEGLRIENVRARRDLDMSDTGGQVGNHEQENQAQGERAIDTQRRIFEVIGLSGRNHLCPRKHEAIDSEPRHPTEIGLLMLIGQMR